MKIKLNRDKSIGKVLFIVEGSKTEPYIIHRIFVKELGYQLETTLRDKKYHKYVSSTNKNSKVFVINTEESNIKFIDKDNEYLNNLFSRLITEYDFDVDNAAIYYIFDRDDHSNTDSDFISAQIVRLVNSRENPDYDRQGMLLLSYPSIESFTLMNFISDSINLSFDTGESLKRYLHTEKINHQKIDINTLNKAAEELIKSLHTINCMYNVDEMSECNTAVYEFEESGKILSQKYRAFSLFVIALIDLGIIEIE